MVIDESARPLLEEFQLANEAEGVAIKELLAYMQGGGRDRERMGTLTNAMSKAHGRKMDVYARLSEVRLDK